MVYERYPRDELSGDEYRGAQSSDRNRQYSSSGGGNRGLFGGDRDDRSDDWRSGGDQRGYYGQGSSSDLSSRGSRYGDDFGARGADFGGSSESRNYGRDAYGRGDDDRGDYGRSSQDRGFLSRGDSSRSDDGRSSWDRSDYGRPDMYRGQGQREPSQRGQGGYNYKERTFFDRAGDEVRSWFGDNEAERRRELDQRYDQRYARGDERDQDYHSWRRGQIASLDRDYDEYRRENQSRFERDFGSWRDQRMQKRGLLRGIREHMEVVGNDDEHVGTVDRVAGDRIILTKSDPESGGVHHSLSCGNIDRVEDNRVILDCTADQAKSDWRDESRSRALFEREDQGEVGPHVLNRSFEGTYR